LIQRRMQELQDYILMRSRQIQLSSEPIGLEEFVSDLQKTIITKTNSSQFDIRLDDNAFMKTFSNDYRLLSSLVKNVSKAILLECNLLSKVKLTISLKEGRRGIKFSFQLINSAHFERISQLLTSQVSEWNLRYSHMALRTLGGQFKIQKESMTLVVHVPEANDSGLMEILKYKIVDDKASANGSK
jgi:hypothetical protein